MSRPSMAFRGALIGLFAGALALLGTAPAAIAGSDQVQGTPVATCPGSGAPVTQNGFTYFNVDAHGNVCVAGSSGGGAVTAISGGFVDGAIVTMGTEADAACSTDNGTCTEIALLKRENQRLTTAITALGSPFQAGGSVGITGTVPVSGAFFQATQPVSGTFFQATQPVSNAGTFAVQCNSGCGGSGGTASSFGSATPAQGTAIGATNGGNMVTVAADASHNLDVNCVVGCAGGTASNASSAVATSSTNGTGDSWLYGFNGTTWDQLQVDGSKNLKVDIAAGTAAVTGTFWQTTQPVSIASLPALPANQSVNNAQVAGTTTSVGNGTTDAGTQRVTLSSDSTGLVKLAAGQNVYGTAQLAATASNFGLSQCFLIATASSNSTNCKAGVGQVYHISIFNNSATVAYLHMINSASAPTCSSATTVDEIMVPANGGVEKELTYGAPYLTGISFCLSGGIAQNDNTSVAASTYLVTVYYK